MPEHFAALVGSLPDDGFAGVNVTVPHKLAALAVADGGLGGGARDRRREHAHLRRRRRDRADNTDAVGIIDAIGERLSDRRALVLGRRRLGARGGLGAARGRRRGLDLEPHRGQGRGAGRRVRRAQGPAGSPRSGAFDLLVNATTVGLRAGKRAPADARRPKGASRGCRFGRRTTSRGGPRLRVARDRARLPRTGARRARDRRARGAGPPGSRLASDLDRARPPARDDAKSGTRQRTKMDERPAHLRPVPAPSSEATARELDEPCPPTAPPG